MDSTLLNEIGSAVTAAAPDRVFILTDTNVAKIEKPLIDTLSAIHSAQTITTPAGEENKSFTALKAILEHLSRSGATRRSLLICIGGGMTTDIGGFAAAIFKRGIRHLNIATTLLAAVDAAVGGKTGIDFAGLKNEVGAFHLPLDTLADAEAFPSLPDSEILSGFGEVIKTALIADAERSNRLLDLDPLEADTYTLADICRFCRNEKMRIVDLDPEEKGLRKVLNFGHTAGHALESLVLRRGHPVPHGVAVAHGILPALVLSMELCGLDKSVVSRYAAWLRKYFPPLGYTCADYEAIWSLASHDKKNIAPDILNYTLIEAPGKPRYDMAVSRPEFENALDLCQELAGR